MSLPSHDVLHRTTDDFYRRNREEGVTLKELRRKEVKQPKQTRFEHTATKESPRKADVFLHIKPIYWLVSVLTHKYPDFRSV